MPGSGGLGAVSIGISETVLVAIAVVVVIGLWKLAKIVWTAFSN